MPTANNEQPHGKHSVPGSEAEGAAAVEVAQPAAASARPKREPRGAGGKTRRPRKKPLAVRASAALIAHPVAGGALSALLVAGGVALVFWFTLFSGIDASADFVYSQF